MATQVNEKSEYDDYPNEKSTPLENKVQLQEEEDEFIDEPKQFTVYVHA
jgi:hypothetical protein